jgi:hypothetical protein
MELSRANTLNKTILKLNLIIILTQWTLLKNQIVQRIFFVISLMKIIFIFIAITLLKKLHNKPKIFVSTIFLKKLIFTKKK